MKYVEVRCMLCSKTYQLNENDKDYNKIKSSDKSGVYICDLCANRVRYEADNLRKNSKPQSN